MRFPNARSARMPSLLTSLLLGASLILASACADEDPVSGEDSAASLEPSDSTPSEVTSGLPTIGGTEPGGTEPGGTEPGGTEPGGTEPGGTEPGGTEPGGTEPGGTEPGGTEPGGTEPGGTEPGGTEPGGTEPGGTDPGSAVPVACRANAQCGQREYCLFDREDPCGDLGTEGACVPIPNGCAGLLDPVCGCDGQTYSNGCVAALTGVNVRHSGSCGAGECVTLPEPGCCFEDGDCSLQTRCVGAVCLPDREEAGTCVARNLARGECWTDEDCTPETLCAGAQRCPCGHACLMPDEPGECQPFIGPPVDPVE